MSDSDLFQTKDSIGRVNGGSVVGHSIIYGEDGERKSGYETNISYTCEDGYIYLIDNGGNFPSQGNDAYFLLGAGTGTLVANKHTYDYWNDNSYDETFTFTLYNFLYSSDTSLNPLGCSITSIIWLG